jgi:hypothetical protein
MASSAPNGISDAVKKRVMSLDDFWVPLIEMGGIFIVAATVVLVPIGVSMYIYCWFDFCHDICRRTTKIKFKQFRTWQAIAPGKWVCKRDRCIYDPLPHKQDLYIAFDLIDYTRYQLWMFKYNRGRKRQEQNEDLVTLLTGVQGDIDYLRNQAEREQRDAIDRMRQAVNADKKERFDL